MKRKSVQIPNFFKVFKDMQGNEGLANLNQGPGSIGGGSRRFTKESVLHRLFKMMRNKAQDFLNGKRSA